MLNISGITKGIVIDHIRVGGSMNIYNYLQLDKLDYSVAIIMNAKSNKMGRKDMIKIEGTLDDVDYNILGALDPNITINIIDDGRIVDKVNPQVPEQITNVIRCKNPRCITSIEQDLPHVFKLTDKKKGLYRCVYCEQSHKR